jgi:hypothetical protein
MGKFKVSWEENGVLCTETIEVSDWDTVVGLKKHLQDSKLLTYADKIKSLELLDAIHKVY